MDELAPVAAPTFFKMGHCTFCDKIDDGVDRNQWNELIRYIRTSENLRSLLSEQIKDRLRRYDIRLIALAIRLKRECLVLEWRNMIEQGEVLKPYVEDPSSTQRKLEERDQHMGNLVDLHQDTWDVIEANVGLFANAAYLSYLEKPGNNEAMIQELGLLVQQCLRKTRILGERPREPSTLRRSSPFLYIFRSAA